MQFTGSQAREGAATHRRIELEVKRFRDGRSGAWFDGTPQSTDRRIAACERVLHLARSGVARSPFDWGTHEIIAELEADHRALVGQREELLNGYADRVAFTDPEPPRHINEDLKAAWREDVANGVNPTERHLPEQYRRTAAKPPWGPGGRGHDPLPPKEGPTPWDAEKNDWAVPSLEQDMIGDRPYKPMPPDPVYKPPGFAEMKARGAYGSLDADEARWAALEGPKFVRANAEVAHFTEELTTRACYYAAKATSGFDHPRETARAFVGAVVEAASQIPRPRMAKVASCNVSDLPPEAMWL